LNAGEAVIRHQDGFDLAHVDSRFPKSSDGRRCASY
jgi:hypothetical protein